MLARPMYKTIHPAYVLAPGITRIGDVPEVAVELDDEDGSVLRLVQLMDGTRSLEALWEKMKEHNPSVTMSEIEQAVEALHDMGFVYDAQDEDGLTQEQRERFKGNLNFLTHYARAGRSPGQLQERLFNARVTLLGMGAFGCSLLYQLAGLGVRHVRAVDFDTVSLSNLNRQMLFAESDVGRPKLDAAKEFMARFYSQMELETVTMEIRSKEDVAQVIAGSDLVLLAADQPFYILPHWVNEACVAQGIPMVAGSILLTHGMVFSMIPGQTGCLDCLLLRRVEVAEDYAQILEQILDLNFIIPNVATAPTLMMVTGMFGSEVMRQLTGLGPAATAGRMKMLNFETLETHVMMGFEGPHAECPTCGAGRREDHPILQLMHRPEYHARTVVDR